jgi:hypothetical protein
MDACWRCASAYGVQVRELGVEHVLRYGSSGSNDAGDWSSEVRRLSADCGGVVRASATFVGFLPSASFAACTWTESWSRILLDRSI